MDDLDTPFPVTVILRRLLYEPQKGQIIAAFPYLLESDGECTVFMHVGQHFSASYSALVQGTEPVDPNAKDAQELLSELKEYGYVITLAKRINSTRRRRAQREEQNREAAFQASLSSQGMPELKGAK